MKYGEPEPIPETGSPSPTHVYESSKPGPYYDGWHDAVDAIFAALMVMPTYMVDPAHGQLYLERAAMVDIVINAHKDSTK